MVQLADWKEPFDGNVKSEQYPFDWGWKNSIGEQLALVMKTRRTAANARIFGIKYLKAVDKMRRKEHCEVSSTGVTNWKMESVSFFQVIVSCINNFKK